MNYEKIKALIGKPPMPPKKALVAVLKDKALKTESERMQMFSMLTGEVVGAYLRMKKPRRCYA